MDADRQAVVKLPDFRKFDPDRDAAARRSLRASGDAPSGRRPRRETVGAFGKYDTVSDLSIDAGALILSANIARRHLDKGQQAIAIAMLYPEPEKGGRGKTAQISKETLGFSTMRLSQARTILRDRNQPWRSCGGNQVQTGRLQFFRS